MTVNEQRCPQCGATLPAGAETCGNCGARIQPQSAETGGAPGAPPETFQPASAKLIYPTTPPKSPLLAAFLSLILLGGGGQLYLGQPLKGAMIMIVSLGTSWFGLGLIAWLLGILDAYMLAKRLEDGKPIGEWDFFWSI